MHTCCKAQKIESNIENVGGSSQEQILKTPKRSANYLVVTTHRKPPSSSIQTQLTGYAWRFRTHSVVSGSPSAKFRQFTPQHAPVLNLRRCATGE